MLTTLRWFNVGLRALVEVGIIAALATWGFSMGATLAVQLMLGFGAPALGFGIWALVDFRGCGRKAEGLRLLEEVVLCSIAVAALYAANLQAWAGLLAGASSAHYALVYACGDRLLRSNQPARREQARGHP